MSSLDHLIDLAKKTGDRLIVHDSFEGRDVVIMGISEYERMIDDIEDNKDVRQMSSSQMLDQINRDIAVWRANKEMDNEWERNEMLADEMENEGPFDPFAETDFHTPDWHSAGSVLEDKYSDLAGKSDVDSLELEDEDDLPLDEDIKIENLPTEVDDKMQVPYVDSSMEIKEDEALDGEEPMFYEEPV